MQQDIAPLKLLLRRESVEGSKFMHDQLQITPAKRKRIYAILTIRSTPSIGSAAHMSGYYYHSSFGNPIKTENDSAFLDLFTPKNNTHNNIKAVSRTAYF